MEIEFGDEFLYGFFDGSQPVFPIGLACQNFLKSLLLIFKRRVFVFSNPCNVCNAFPGDRDGQMIQEQPGILLVRSIMYEAADCFTARPRIWREAALQGHRMKKVCQKVRLIAHLQVTEARLDDGA